MLQTLNDQDLICSTHAAIETETRAATNVVRHFFEIKKRELHLKRAKPTLFAFIESEFGLDPTSIQRRVNAVELAVSVPEVLDWIDAGQLSLSSAAEHILIIRSANLSRLCWGSHAVRFRNCCRARILKFGFPIRKS